MEWNGIQERKNGFVKIVVQLISYICIQCLVLGVVFQNSADT